MRLIDADAAIKDARLNYGDVHDAVLMEHFLNSQPTVRCKNCACYTNALEVIEAINAELSGTRNRNCKNCKYKGDRSICRGYFRSSGTEDCWDWCGSQKNYGKTEIMRSPNDPLTLEELREIYDGEQGPIWIRFGVVVMPAILDRYDGELMAIWSALGKDDALSEKNYGYTWAAYRRRPEEGTL